jgi:hypothetical protein
MGAVRLLRYLAPVVLIAALAGCGNGSSSSPQSGSDTTGTTTDTTPSSSLEVRPVFVRYSQGLPGNAQLGPTVPQNLLSTMKKHDCSSKASELSGMLLLCDSSNTVYLVKDPIITGGVSKAEAKQVGHSKLWYVEVTFDQSATSTLSQTSQSMAGTDLAFVFDGKVVSALPADSSMADGTVGLIGTYDEQQAKQLASQLTAGG